MSFCFVRKEFIKLGLFVEKGGLAGLLQAFYLGESGYLIFYVLFEAYCTEYVLALT